MKLNIIDLFSGAGGLSAGFEQTGCFEVIGAVELNRAAAETYIMNHGGNEEILIKAKGASHSNIKEIDFTKFIKEKKIDRSKLVVLGGPPCQGFSNANRQKNYLISGNNQLVKEFIRAIDEMRPIAFLMENVKTIISEKHKFFVTYPKQLRDYSSEQHLHEITKLNSKYSNESPIWKNDTITLLDSRHEVLIPIIQSVVQENYDTPIFSDERLISRLRVIEKGHIQKSRVKTRSYMDDRCTNDLINHLNNQNNNIDLRRLGALPIIQRALTGLQKIKAGELKLINLMNTVGPLIELNSLLLHMRELNDERIVNTVHVDPKNPLKVKARVKSYNVVEYLECVFQFFDYKIDLGTVKASDFGVPQKRTRFVIIGVNKSLDTPRLPQWKISNVFTTWDAISDLATVTPGKDIKKCQVLDYPLMEKSFLFNPLQRYFRSGSKGIYNHVNTESEDLSLKRFEEIRKKGGKNFHSLSDDMKTTYFDVSRTQNTIYLRLNYHEPSPTVVNVRKSMWNHPENAVAISIREAARLQSFRDNFIFCGTKDQQYQQIGNAVPPLMARALAESILKSLEVEPKTSLLQELQGIKDLQLNEIETLV